MDGFATNIASNAAAIITASAEGQRQAMRLLRQRRHIQTSGSGKLDAPPGTAPIERSDDPPPAAQPPSDRPESRQQPLGATLDVRA